MADKAVMKRPRGSSDEDGELPKKKTLSQSESEPGTTEKEAPPTSTTSSEVNRPEDEDGVGKVTEVLGNLATTCASEGSQEKEPGNDKKDTTYEDVIISAMSKDLDVPPGSDRRLEEYAWPGPSTSTSFVPAVKMEERSRIFHQAVEGVFGKDIQFDMMKDPAIWNVLRRMKYIEQQVAATATSENAVQRFVPKRDEDTDMRSPQKQTMESQADYMERVRVFCDEILSDFAKAKTAFDENKREEEARQKRMRPASEPPTLEELREQAKKELDREWSRRDSFSEIKWTRVTNTEAEDDKHKKSLKAKPIDWEEQSCSGPVDSTSMDVLVDSEEFEAPLVAMPPVEEPPVLRLRPAEAPVLRLRPAEAPVLRLRPADDPLFRLIPVEPSHDTHGMSLDELQAIIRELAAGIQVPEGRMARRSPRHQKKYVCEIDRNLGRDLVWEPICSSEPAIGNSVNFFMKISGYLSY